MTEKVILQTALHEIPADLENALKSDEELLDKWNALTPIARNEWVCWITIVKKGETRQKHIVRMKEDLLKEKKRPCCWAGCPHRRESKKWFKQYKETN